ncbi:MAG: TIGR04086 family membrane protein [Oscillospiraceae bacterium]
MKAHRRRKKSILENYNMNIMVSSMVGMLSIFVSMCICALIVSHIDVSIKVVSLMSVMSLGIGSYIAGYLSSIKRQKIGIISGILCGIVISSIMIVFGLIFIKNFNIYNKICKVVISLICSIIGGIKSANSHVA